MPCISRLWVTPISFILVAAWAEFIPGEKRTNNSPETCSASPVAGGLEPLISWADTDGVARENASTRLKVKRKSFFICSSKNGTVSDTKPIFDRCFWSPYQSDAWNDKSRWGLSEISGPCFWKYYKNHGTRYNDLKLELVTLVQFVIPHSTESLLLRG